MLKIQLISKLLKIIAIVKDFIKHKAKFRDVVNTTFDTPVANMLTDIFNRVDSLPLDAKIFLSAYMVLQLTPYKDSSLTIASNSIRKKALSKTPGAAEC